MLPCFYHIVVIVLYINKDNSFIYPMAIIANEKVSNLAQSSGSLVLNICTNDLITASVTSQR